MARPKIEIDAKEVYKLAQIGCRNEEIADWFGCSAQTIETRFQPELDKGRSELRMTLRRWQLESAKKGNVAMLIWLGKQMLKQTDVQAVNLTNDGKNQITVEIKDYTKKD